MSKNLGGGEQNVYPVYANESDPESLLNAINKLNDQNKNRMSELKK